MIPYSKNIFTNLLLSQNSKLLFPMEGIKNAVFTWVAICVYTVFVLIYFVYVNSKGSVLCIALFRA